MNTVIGGGSCVSVYLIEAKEIDIKIVKLILEAGFDTQFNPGSKMKKVIEQMMELEEIDMHTTCLLLK